MDRSSSASSDTTPSKVATVDFNPFPLRADFAAIRECLQNFRDLETVDAPALAQLGLQQHVACFRRISNRKVCFYLSDREYIGQLFSDIFRALNVLPKPKSEHDTFVAYIQRQADYLKELIRERYELTQRIRVLEQRNGFGASDAKINQLAEQLAKLS